VYVLLQTAKLVKIQIQTQVLFNIFGIKILIANISSFKQVKHAISVISEFKSDLNIFSIYEFRPAGSETLLNTKNHF
jgi:hypothetical protein